MREKWGALDEWREKVYETETDRSEKTDAEMEECYLVLAQTYLFSLLFPCICISCLHASMIDAQVIKY